MYMDILVNEMNVKLNKLYLYIMQISSLFNFSKIMKDLKYKYL